jgi:3-methyladenine DNA glycosylase Mpg
MDLTSSDSTMWLEDGLELPPVSIVISTRIGIDGAGADSANKPYRFYEKNNEHVSVLDPADRKRRREELREKAAAKRAKKT